MLAVEEPAIAAVLHDGTILLAHALKLKDGYVYPLESAQDTSTIQQYAADGRRVPDSSLASGMEGPRILFLQPMPDGRILAGRRSGIVRFLPNGQMDGGFRAPPLINVSKIQIVGDKILVLHSWELHKMLFRLKQDGGVDATFRVPDLKIDDQSVSH